MSKIAMYTTPRAVLFDIDGTLYSDFYMFCSAPLSYLKIMPWILAFRRMRITLRAWLQKKQDVDEHTFWEFSVSLFAKETKLSLKEAEFLLENKIYTGWIQALSSTPLRYAMRKLIGDLYRKNIILGVLSDFRAKEKLDNWNISKYFTSIVCAEDHCRLKPDPVLFKMVCENIEVPAQECVYVGNHMRYDGLGALGADMPPIIFHAPNAVSKRHAIKTVQSVAALRRALNALGIRV